MQVAKIKLETIIRDLPEMVDIEEVMYHLYLLEKIEAGEADIREGRVLSHNQAVARLARKWQENEAYRKITAAREHFSRSGLNASDIYEESRRELEDGS